jgi:CHASE3 domain sensor protein
MIRSWTFGKKIAAGFLFAGATLLVIAVVAYANTQTLIENDRQVSHTHQVRGAIGEVLSLLKDMETGYRGYVITGNEAFLEPYTAALGEIDKTLDGLRRLTSDNRLQQQRLDALGPSIKAKVADVKSNIELRRTAGFEPAAKVVAGGEGKRSMDQLRVMLGDMDRDERELLDARHAQAESSAQVTTGVIVGGSIAGIVAIVLIGLLITHSLSKQIGAAVQHVRTSSTQLQSAATQQATGAREQATALNEITTTMRELMASSRQIAESARHVAEIAEETASASRSGTSVVDRAQESISGIRRQVDLIVAHMLELGKKSQQIGAVLDIVSELAEQTNILAINATIEAVGAGETGRRFAIVADEIRKLADRVAGSTKEIKGLIDDVRGAVNTTVMATEGGSKSVDAGTRQFSDVADSFKQIAGMVITTTQAAKEIELSTKQQTSAVEQINLGISSVAQATTETEASSGQTLQAVSLLSGLSGDLLRLVRPRAAA